MGSILFPGRKKVGRRGSGRAVMLLFVVEWDWLLMDERMRWLWSSATHPPADSDKWQLFDRPA